MLISFARLFKDSLVCKNIPSNQKKANVLPLHRKGSERICTNYRPVSLLSCTGKVMEKVNLNTCSTSSWDLKLCANQSGFIPVDSTMNQLLTLYHEFCLIQLGKVRDKQVCIIFLDISKDFDKVWHSGLLHKLPQRGINEQLLEWFKDYLSNRSKRIAIEGTDVRMGTNSCWCAIGFRFRLIIFYFHKLNQA